MPAPFFIGANSISLIAEFPLSGDEANSLIINLHADKPVTSSALTTLLAPNVALPTDVEIQAFVNNAYQVVLAKINMTQQTVMFPETTASDWMITFHYSQPLRITELRLVQDNQNYVSKQAIRFLAQPNTAYQIYFDPDRNVSVRTSEAGNLASNADVLVLKEVVTAPNPFYHLADTDVDGIPDLTDNCVSIYNPDQKDINYNGRGDLCDDYDKDGVINSKDNCPNNPNYNQADTDHDGIGDACDTQESRLTERYRWIPWLGIIFALGVVVVLFTITLRAKNPNK